MVLEADVPPWTALILFVSVATFFVAVVAEYIQDGNRCTCRTRVLYCLHGFAGNLITNPRSQAHVAHVRGDHKLKVSLDVCVSHVVENMRLVS